MKKKRREKEVHIIGYVISTGQDFNDLTSAISFETEDDEYFVEDNKLGEELFDLVDDKVEVTGMVKEDEDGTKWIRITSYEVLESEYVNTDYEDYEDYELEEDDEEEAFREGWTY